MEHGGRKRSEWRGAHGADHRKPGTALVF
jgi:hypothetical protein